MVGGVYVFLDVGVVLEAWRGLGHEDFYPRGEYGVLIASRGYLKDVGTEAVVEVVDDEVGDEFFLSYHESLFLDGEATIDDIDVFTVHDGLALLVGEVVELLGYPAIAGVEDVEGVVHGGA